MRRSTWLVAFLLTAAAAQPAGAQAPDPASLAGEYCLTGVREVGSCLRLHADGRFEYFLAYGAYDEGSEGTWRLDGGEVVLDSPPYDRRPTFSLKRMQRSDSGAYEVVVEVGSGRAIAGIDVRPTCDGRTFDAGITQSYAVPVECQAAPSSIALGLAMFGLEHQSVDVAAGAGADKVYVFAFDPGDLGRKRFAGVRLRLADGGALVMTYSDTPIRELSGRAFRYVRQ
jgi:hypothetical protein